MDVPSLVRGEGVPAAGGESDVREVLAAEEVPRQPAQLAAVVAPLQPQLGLATSGHFGTLNRIPPFLYFTTSRPDVQQIQRGKREGPLTAD